MFKKGVALIIILTLLSVLFAGCQETTEPDTTTSVETTQAATAEQTQETAAVTEETPQFDEILTITGYLRGKETNVWDGNEMQQIIADKFGILMDLEFSWDYTEKYNLMFAANNLPDFFRAAINDDAFKAAGDDGQFINYLDYLDKLPNIEALLKKYPSDLASNISQEGGLYSLHYETRYGGDGIYWPNSVFMVRNDLLEAGGIDVNEIKTLDDFYDMLVVLKDQNDTAPIGIWTDPDSTGIPSIAGVIGNMMGAGTFSPAITSGAVTGLYWNEEEQQYEGSYYRENQKEWLTFIAKLYDEGMINADFLTTDKEGLYVQALTGEITFSYMEPARLVEWNDGTEIESADWTYVMPVTYEGESYKIKTSLDGKLYLEKGKAINAQTITDEGLDRLLNFINWLYSSEGIMWGKAGIEDKDWAVYDEYDTSSNLTDQPYIYLSEAYKDNYPEKYWDMLIPADVYSASASNLYGIFRVDDFFTQTDAWWMFSKTTNPGDSLQTEVNIAYKDAEAVAPVPNISFVTDYEEERNMIQDNIVTYLDEIELKILLGQIDVEAEWDNIVSRLQALDYDRLIELYNMAYENNEDKIVEVTEMLGE